MHNIKTKHTDNMVFELWSEIDDNVQDHMRQQLHGNIQHPLWVQMSDKTRNQMRGQMREHIQNRVREYINAQY